MLFRSEITPVGDSPAAKVQKKVEKESADPRHKKIMELWAKHYPEYHDGRQYVFTGGKDGNALKRLLKTLDRPFEEIMDLISNAWKSNGFWCKQANTIAGFCAAFVNIREELSSSKQARYTDNDRMTAEELAEWRAANEKLKADTDAETLRLLRGE